MKNWGGEKKKKKRKSLHTTAFEILQTPSLAVTRMTVLGNNIVCLLGENTHYHRH